MNNQEYEQKKRECWEEFIGNDGFPTETMRQCFNYAFDRAYVLGKQFGNSEQVDAEKAAKRYADEIRIPASIPGVMVSFINGLAHDAYLQGAQDFLGKPIETITQEEIEKAAEAFTTPPIGNGGMFTREQVKELLVKFAQLFPGKQENDADTVIQGWVARDERHNALNLHAEKPYRAMSGYRIDSKRDWWDSECASFLPLDKNLFPDLTWESEPEQVEIQIKRKKK